MTVIKSSTHGRLIADRATHTRHARPRCRGSIVSALLLASTFAAPAIGASVGNGHPHDEILATVEGAALNAAWEQGLEEVEVRVRPLDQRLRPAQCDQPLEVVRQPVGRVLGPVSYGVRCAGSVPWTLYLRADVSAALELPVLRTALPRGALIGAGDITIEHRRISSEAMDFIADPAIAEGMQLKRALPAGAPLRHGQITLPRLIDRGQTVTLVAGTPGLEVSMQAKALANGAQGDKLWVTNLTSGKRVQGVVLADGSVRVQ